MIANGLATGTSTSAAAIYNLESVAMSFGTGKAAVRAIDGVDLQISRGEFVAIAGSSGSGKTTLLRLLGTLDRHTEGLIEFGGRDLGRHCDGALTQMRLWALGFVFQRFNLLPTLTAQENVEVAMAPRGLGRAERQEAARAMLERVQLGDRSRHLPNQLSRGDQQRVAIARALSNQPDVVLADEPTGDLDAETGRSILGLLRELWMETGFTLILVTHDEAIAARAPRLLRLSNGRIGSLVEPGASALGLQR